MLINIHMSEVTPEVRSNPSLSLDDVQVMINSTLGRQVKSNNEIMRRLMEVRDENKIADSNVCASLLLVLLILLKPILIQVVHRQVAHHIHTHQPSRRTTSTVEPLLMVWLLLMVCHNRLQLACLGKGRRTQHLAFLCQTLVWSHTLPGVMVGHMQTPIAIIKPCTLLKLTPIPYHYPTVRPDLGRTTRITTTTTTTTTQCSFPPIAHRITVATVTRPHHNFPLDHN
jgi:hypothetical protein